MNLIDLFSSSTEIGTEIHFFEKLGVTTP